MSLKSIARPGLCLYISDAAARTFPRVANEVMRSLPDWQTFVEPWRISLCALSNSSLHASHTCRNPRITYGNFSRDVQCQSCAVLMHFASFIILEEQRHELCCLLPSCPQCADTVYMTRIPCAQSHAMLRSSREQR